MCYVLVVGLEKLFIIEAARVLNFHPEALTELIASVLTAWGDINALRFKDVGLQTVGSEQCVQSLCCR